MLMLDHGATLPREYVGLMKYLSRNNEVIDSRANTLRIAQVQ